MISQEKPILLFIFFCLIVMVVTGCIGDTQDNVSQPTEISTSNLTTEPDLTLDAEKEIILELTNNPENAHLITPYYADILFNEAVRFITATPTLNPVIPTPECFLVADFWQLYDLEETIEANLLKENISATTEAFVSVVWNVDSCGDYTPVTNRITVWVDENTLPTPQNFQLIFISIVQAITITAETLHDISVDKSNVEIAVNFSVADSSTFSYLFADVKELDELISQQLSADHFVERLGGIQEGN